MQKHILKVLENYKKAYLDDPMADIFIDFVKENRECTDRKNMLGHFTVSAIVLSGKKVLVIYHKALGISIQPGGHIDGEDKNLFDAAIREVKEETGLDADRPSGEFAYIPLLLDIHDIPENKKKEEGEHKHYDIFFMLVMKDKKQKIENKDDGTDNAKWEELENLKANSSLGKVNKKLKSLKLI